MIKSWELEDLRHSLFILKKQLNEVYYFIDQASHQQGKTLWDILDHLFTSIDNALETIKKLSDDVVEVTKSIEKITENVARITESLALIAEMLGPLFLLSNKKDNTEGYLVTFMKLMWYVNYDKIIDYYVNNHKPIYTSDKIPDLINKLKDSLLLKKIEELAENKMNTPNKEEQKMFEDLIEAKVRHLTQTQRRPLKLEERETNDS